MNTGWVPNWWYWVFLPNVQLYFYGWSFYFVTVNCYFSGNLLMVLASTFITADFFWTKVKCFMSDLFLSLFFSISAKKNLIHARGQWVEWMKAYIAYVPVVGNSRWSFLQIVCFSVCFSMHLTVCKVSLGHTSAWDVWETVHVDCYQRNRERKWYSLAPDSPNEVFEVCSK